MEKFNNDVVVLSPNNIDEHMKRVRAVLTRFIECRF